MERTDKSLYIPDASDDSTSIELLPKQYKSFNEALIDNHRQLNLQRISKVIDVTTSPDEDDSPSSLAKTSVRYKATSDGSQQYDYSDANEEYIIQVHRNGELSPTYKRISSDASLSSEVATTHTDMSSSTSAWEQLANERGVEIQQLEYRIALMQKVIRQYERKSEKIKRIAEAACSRHDDLEELGESYMERGIGHEGIPSDDEDHKTENTCTYSKHR